ncbi:Thiol:disulfide oxidoreductase [Streptococcus sp. DD11]|uniref:thiol-disulfide oxidoreductase-associated lipoprotein SdbB n=1 Tax=Streptococcus sp. DD11 TaxID=1777879 RepID=UPI00079CA27C|nr:thiol-disulfide oxidoreductase-associated lipoprotein SdbB [Streptococcus sp. DD11]KXT81433.1 Thiol:disulfide oxidoreductase [Streptococcus sp. DD11]
MKKTIGLLTVLLAAVSLAACSEQAGNGDSSGSSQSSSSPAQSTFSPIAVGEEAPDFTLQSMDGKTVKLSDYRGKKVYLKFWASWCPPCRKSMPELEELAARTDRDFEILSIVAPEFQGEKSTEEFPKWFAEQGYKYVPVLFDTQAAAFQAYQIRSIPTEVLIDSQGKIGKIQLGVISNADAEAAFQEMK